MSAVRHVDTRSWVKSVCWTSAKFFVLQLEGNALGVKKGRSLFFITGTKKKIGLGAAGKTAARAHDKERLENKMQELARRGWRFWINQLVLLFMYFRKKKSLYVKQFNRLIIDPFFSLTVLCTKNLDIAIWKVENKFRICINIVKFCQNFCLQTTSIEWENG